MLLRYTKRLVSLVAVTGVFGILIIFYTSFNVSCPSCGFRFGGSLTLKTARYHFSSKRTSVDSPSLHLQESSTISKGTLFTPLIKSVWADAVVKNSVRSEHPRLFASAEDWNHLWETVPKDVYLYSWNRTIFETAEAYLANPTLVFPSSKPMGDKLLDVARDLQQRMKHWGYAYRLTRDPRWAHRAWEDLLVASGNSSQAFGEPGDTWNTQ